MNARFFSIFFRPLASAVAALALLGPPLTAAVPATNLPEIKALESEIKQVAAKAMPATVALVSERTGSSGSGVVVSPDGLILTAAHVIQGAESMVVIFPNGKQATADVLGANYSRDSAMVKIRNNGPWPYVQLGHSRPLSAGDWVVALGHSAGFDVTRTPPIRFGRVISTGPGHFLTTDCTLIGGDSGGPLFDLAGRLVAIHSSIGTQFENNNHAGIDGFLADWKRLKSGESWGRLSLNPFDNPELPVLGILMDMDRNRQGVTVAQVTPESPAAAAGVRVGDRIQQVDEEPVRHGEELLQIIAKRQPGEIVKLHLLRGNQALTIHVKLARREALFDRTPSRNVLLSSEIPLLRPDEKKTVTQQSRALNQALEPSLATAARSTVRIWARNRRLAYGTVVGNGQEILTKWSEVRGHELLQAEADNEALRVVVINRVYRDEDLAILEIVGPPLPPIKWSQQELELGEFLIAPQPDGRPAAVGVVSVRERNLRHTDQPYLGLTGETGYTGPGVRIVEVDPDSGAAKAGLKPGDVILKIKDRPLSGLLELRNALNDKQPGDAIELLVESDGARYTLRAVLSNRTDHLPRFPSGRLNYMERMGGAISRVRDAFGFAVQTDMRPEPNQIGGPVTNLAGEAVGISLARADRTRSFIMPTHAIESLLKTPGESNSDAMAHQREASKLASSGRQAQRRNAPRTPNRPPAYDQEHMDQQLNDLRRLQELLDNELEALR